VTVAGELQVLPLKIETCRLPVVAVAAQITLPPPSLAQLGSELTVIAKVFHPFQAVPFSSSTIMAALPVRTAQTTCPVTTNAHDGLPTPVAVPVETNAPQEAEAAGIIPRQTTHNMRNCGNRDIQKLLLNFGRA
jgi:hypothetical protein